MARLEQSIFDDLATLCVSPGFIHAVAYLCFRDNTIRFHDQLTPNDLAVMHEPSRLVRTEMSTLIGLMVRQPIDFTLPTPTVIQSYIERSEALLQELHDGLSEEWQIGLDPEKLISGVSNPFSNAAALREPIFYSGESAYAFQYRDLARQKYAADAAWLLERRALCVPAAIDAMKALASLLNGKLKITELALKELPLRERTMLPGFTFTSEELATHAAMPSQVVTSVLEAFTYRQSEQNPTFKSLSEYNATNAYPLLKLDSGEFVLLQYYSFVEALYETPFFWMSEDKEYAPTAYQHRGDFTELFALDRLTRVFGGSRVYRGVRILKSENVELGEIDVLVIFGDQAIVLQAKSKRLTIEARKGNDFQLKDDFRKAIQESNDQAFSCAKALMDKSFELRDANNQPLILEVRPKRIFPVCIVADHYPALSFQARQFLRFETTEHIVSPLVTDVFALDAMTEMLGTPLYFLSYLSHRARFGERLISGHEITLLSYHLKLNLWVNQNFDMVQLHDDISADLDVAMAARRDGIPGAITPDGILTRFKDTHVGRLIGEIESNSDPLAIALGLRLLELSEETIEKINSGIETITLAAARDGQCHDFTIGMEPGSDGITIHCNPAPDLQTHSKLLNHCRMRKYRLKAKSWFGLAIRQDGKLRFALKGEYPWKHDVEMDMLTSRMSIGSAGKNKHGRNAPCPCGSGRKFKKCCLR